MKSHAIFYALRKVATSFPALSLGLTNRRIQSSRPGLDSAEVDNTADSMPVETKL